MMFRWNLQRLVLMIILGIGLILTLSNEPMLTSAHAQATSQDGRVSLAGRVIDPQGEPIRGAEVSLILNAAASEPQTGHPVTESQADGSFVLDIPSESMDDIETLVKEL